jgi:hypothetical protein
MIDDAGVPDGRGRVDRLSSGVGVGAVLLFFFFFPDLTY